VRSRVRINTPDVISEVIDGEVVALSFGTGSYFSIKDGGVAIWQLIEAGADLQTIEDVLADRSAYSRETVAGWVRSFVDELRKEGLVVDGPNSGMSELPEAVLSDGIGKPVLERFDEMKEMLLYDPIHDVDDTGWPNRPGDTG